VLAAAALSYQSLMQLAELASHGRLSVLYRSSSTPELLSRVPLG
jgi:hypothetical protein